MREKKRKENIPYINLQIITETMEITIWLEIMFFSPYIKKLA